MPRWPPESAGFSTAGSPARASASLPSRTFRTAAKRGCGTPASASRRRIAILWVIACATAVPIEGRPSASVTAATTGTARSADTVSAPSTPCRRATSVTAATSVKSTASPTSASSKPSASGFRSTATTRRPRSRACRIARRWWRPAPTNRTDFTRRMLRVQDWRDAPQPLPRRPARRGARLDDRHPDDLRRAALVRARDDGVARADERRAGGRDPARGALRDPERQRRRAARRQADAAPLRPGARAADRRRAAAPLGRPRSPSRRSSRSSSRSGSSRRPTSPPSARSCRSSSATTRRWSRRPRRSSAARTHVTIVDRAGPRRRPRGRARRVGRAGDRRRDLPRRLRARARARDRRGARAPTDDRARRARGRPLPAPRPAARAADADGDPARRRARALFLSTAGARLPPLRRATHGSSAGSSRSSARARSPARRSCYGARRLPPLRLAATAVVLFAAVPLWALVRGLPWYGRRRRVPGVSGSHSRSRTRRRWGSCQHADRRRRCARR